MKIRVFSGWLGMLALLLLLSGTALAQTPRKKLNTGFQNLSARFVGGYAITTPSGNLAGESKLRIKAPKNGRSAQMTWTNTFYGEHGSSKVILRWSFLPNGVFVANSVEPRSISLPASGMFTINGNRPIVFSATTGGVKARGEIRRVGGGNVSVTMTLTGLPEGEVTYSFSGGRIR